MSPRLARVRGLLFFIYNREENQRPHVQVRAGDDRATLDIATGDILVGSLPPKLHRRAREWIEPRREALNTAFFAALSPEDPARIIADFEEATRGL
jgi:hypothetical protein